MNPIPRPEIYFKNGYWRVRRRDTKRGKAPAIVEQAYEFVNRMNHTDEAYAYRRQIQIERKREWVMKNALRTK